MIKKKTPRDYKFIRLIGEGSFSSVYLAVDANLQLQEPPKLSTTGDSQEQDANATITTKTTTTIKVRKYAIKVCQKAHIKRQGKQVAIMREKEIMNILNLCPSEHFIRLYCTFQDMERLFFVMSYADHGDLLTYMLKYPLTIDQVRRFTLQLVDALEHLHKLGIVHRDLKPENILLGELLNILISDFGSAQIYTKSTSTSQPDPSATLLPPPSSISSALPDNPSHLSMPSQTLPRQGSRSLQNETDSIGSALGSLNSCTSSQSAKTTPTTSLERRNSFVGTAQYVSPEMLKNRQASNKSDLWALGVIIFQMITNVMPFDAPNEYLIYKKIQNLDYEFPEDFDQNARNLVSSLVKLKPQDRLGALDDLQQGYSSIRQHEFLMALDESRLHLGPPLTASTYDDPDLKNIDKIVAGLDETQLLRLLTDD